MGHTYFISSPLPSTSLSLVAFLLLPPGSGSLRTAAEPRQLQDTAPHTLQAPENGFESWGGQPGTYASEARRHVQPWCMKISFMAFKPNHRQHGLTWLESPDFKADHLHHRASWTLNLPSSLSLPWVGAHWSLSGIHSWKKMHFLHTLTGQANCPGFGPCQGWRYGPMVYTPPSLCLSSLPPDTAMAGSLTLFRD